MYDTVIFDLDGTLLNTLDDIYVGVNNAMLICGFPIKTKDEVRLAVGDGAAKLISRCMPKGEEGRFEECLTVFKAEYSKCKEDKTAPYPLVLRALNRLKELGVKVGVVSNKPEPAVKALCDKWFNGLVSVAVGDDGIRPLKPNPQAIEFALAKLGSDKQSAFYVGDQELDVLSAKNSGLKLIGAGWGFRGKEALMDAGAETVFSSPWEIAQMLEKKE